MVTSTLYELDLYQMYIFALLLFLWMRERERVKRWTSWGQFAFLTCFDLHKFSMNQKCIIFVFQTKTHPQKHHILFNTNLHNNMEHHNENKHMKLTSVVSLFSISLFNQNKVNTPINWPIFKPNLSKNWDIVDNILLPIAILHAHISLKGHEK